MPRKSRQTKQNNPMSQDELWQQAWNGPRSMDAAKKQALLNNIHQRIAPNRRRKKLFFISISAAAAILVAVFLKLPNHQLRTPANHWQELASNDSAKKIQLQDGSELWLAPHSAIRVYTDFLNQRNTELTKGTVFFSVAKDAQHPFSIRINRQQVTVLGTAFTIHKLDSVDLQLTVKEGKVALDDQGGRRLLTAGQQVSTAHALAGQVKTINPAAADWWLQQQVRLHNISLEELLNRVETYYQVKLSHGKINPTMKVTLTWDLGIPLDDNLTVLNTLTGYKIH
jgi:transmembrane sensor